MRKILKYRTSNIRVTMWQPIPPMLRPKPVAGPQTKARKASRKSPPKTGRKPASKRAFAMPVMSVVRTGIRNRNLPLRGAACSSIDYAPATSGPSPAETSTLPSVPTTGLPFSGRWSGAMDELCRDFTELASKLGDLLDHDENESIEMEDAPFKACPREDANRLDRIPILIGCLAGLLIPERDRANQELIPLVRAVVPDGGFRIVDIFRFRGGDHSLRLIDEMYRCAVHYDSQAIADLTDTVLFTLAVGYGEDCLLDRLVSRFYELHLAKVPPARSLADRVHSIAMAKLQMMRLKAGHTLPRVLLGSRTMYSPRDATVQDDLTIIIERSESEILDIIRLWLDRRIKLLAKHERELDLARPMADVSTVRNNKGALSRSVREAKHMAKALERVRWLHDHTFPTNNELDDLFDGLPEDGVEDGPSDGTADGDTSGVYDGEDVEVSGLRIVDRSRKGGRSKPDNAGKRNAATALSTLWPEHSPSRKGQAKVTGNRNRAGKSGSGDVLFGETASDVEDGIVVVPAFDKTGNRDIDDRLAPYRDGLAGQRLPLVRMPDLGPIRSRLVHMLPHLEPIIDRILTAMAPHQDVKLPPILLIGRPGCGKTTLLEELAKELNAPSVTIDGAGLSDANLLGVDYRWYTGAPGIHLDLITDHRVANPIIILDELEKVGGSDRNGDIRHKLLGLLEPRRASSFMCPYLGKPTNLCGVNWLFSANTNENIPLPLINRLEVINCPMPGKNHLETLAGQLLVAEYKSRGLHAGWATPLTPTELNLLARYWAGGSIRNLHRLVKAMIDARERFVATV